MSVDLLARLTNRLDQQVSETARYVRYIEGRPNLAFASSKYRTAFGSTLSALSVNWPRLVVDSLVERMSVNGFHTSASSTGDPDAWNIWQASNLDADAAILTAEAMIHGQAFAIVWPNADGFPTISVES